ncbi:MULTISPECIES: MT-A70 family methyltransferase [unclassified Tatumella]|uniref:MT-A70 family methyltransferase n=1 Tax=unclassified Tatumella TaxID=2649542 RepID=UPI0032C4430D
MENILASRRNYTLIYADPPWQYRDSANDGARGATHKYPVMNVQDICRLPVWDLANPESCLLAMWWVPTQPLEALKVVEAWGFRLMTMKGFTWHKTNRRKGNSAIGIGHMTRANSEDCLFAVKGKLPERLDASICQHITAPRLEHSAKPQVVRDMLVKLLGDVPRIELFSRGDAAGWHHFGNENPRNDVELFSANFKRQYQSLKLNFQEIILSASVTREADR